MLCIPCVREETWTTNSKLGSSQQKVVMMA